MQIIPVLDLLGGVVVRGVGGRRDEYAPIQSQLADSAEPLAVADALQQTFGCAGFYLADLGAIMHRWPHEREIRELAARGHRLMVDAGLRTAADAQWLKSLPVEIIAGLESIRGPEDLQAVLNDFGADRLIFSLDLKAGRPLVADGAEWPSEPFEIAQTAMQFGCQRLIVLDLASVGSGGGPASLPLCRQIRQQFPDTRLITGGGVRNRDDLTLLADAGIDGVLVASALHDGSLTAADIRSFT